MQALTRSAIFKQSVFVDNQIALAQQVTHRTINQDDSDEVAYMMPFLDHLQPFHVQQNSLLDGFCVLAYPAETKEDYESNFLLLMADFFTRLNIEELYLLTECRNDWKDFVFENKEKQKRFLSMANDQTNGVGYQVKVKDLPEAMPVFLFTHLITRILFLFPRTEMFLLICLYVKTGICIRCLMREIMSN